MAAPSVTITKNAGEKWRVSVNFTDDLAAAGAGITIASTPTVAVAAGDVTATYITYQTGGIVSLWVEGGTAATVAMATVTATYSNGEIVVGRVYVEIRAAQ